MTKPMPTWLTDKLIHDGVMTTDRVTKHARPRLCKTCGLFTLTGLDDLLPKVTHVDLQPTTTAGEAFALLTGRTSYGMDHGELFERYASRIELRRADDTPVYISHSCNSPALPTNKKFYPDTPAQTTGKAPF